MFLTLSARVNRIVGPFLLRHGLSARYRLGGGVIRDNPVLDNILMIPFAQKLVSLESQQEAVDMLSQTKKDPSAFETWANATFDRIFGPDSSMKDPSRGQEEEAYSNVRLIVFHNYMRRILVPNERWSDVMRWQFQLRFLKWARAEFLTARYGPDLREALHSYPKLRLSPQLTISSSKQQLQSLFDRAWGATIAASGDRGTDGSSIDYVLPKCNVVRKAFRMQRWNRQKKMDAGWRRLTKLTKQLGGQVVEPRNGLRVAIVPPDTDVSALSIEDLLEVAGGHVASCGPFNLLCEECDVYQLWTTEYVEALAKYLLHRSRRRNTLILDVGAGDGLLAQLVKDSMNKQLALAEREVKDRDAGRHAPPRVIAVDNGSWGIPTDAPVEKLNAQEALAKYTEDSSIQQVIVLCSWMPMGEDWSATFRSHNVEEYILIGEYDDGNCGDNWLTWGNVDYVATQQDDPGDSIGLPPTPQYKQDGYVRINLDELLQFQFARFDSSDSSTSMSVVFRRRSL